MTDRKGLRGVEAFGEDAKRLGLKPQSVEAILAAIDATCACFEGAYIGTQMVGEPVRCQRCKGLIADAPCSRTASRGSWCATHNSRWWPQVPTCSASPRRG